MRKDIPDGHQWINSQENKIEIVVKNNSELYKKINYEIQKLESYCTLLSSIGIKINSKKWYKNIIKVSHYQRDILSKYRSGSFLTKNWDNWKDELDKIEEKVIKIMANDMEESLSWFVSNFYWSKKMFKDFSVLNQYIYSYYIDFFENFKYEDNIDKYIERYKSYLATTYSNNNSISIAKRKKLIEDLDSSETLVESLKDYKSSDDLIYAQRAWRNNEWTIAIYRNISSPGKIRLNKNYLFNEQFNNDNSIKFEKGISTEKGYENIALILETINFYLQTVIKLKYVFKIKEKKRVASICFDRNRLDMDGFPLLNKLK